MRIAASLAVAFSGACVEPDDTHLSSSADVVLASEFDFYSATATLTDAVGQPLRPVHVNLMPDGRVLMIGREGNAGLLVPSFDSGAIQLQPASAPYEVPTFTVFG